MYPVSPVKERYRKGGKWKISRVLQSPVPSTQASPKVEASHRLKQAQHFSTRKKVQNGNSRVHQNSLIPGEWVSLIDLSDAYLHIPIHPNSRKYLKKWCRENSVDFSTPSVKQISDFFMYLYQDLNRRPSTIDGYRTAIVDTLGPTTHHIAHNADLHRLLFSFHKDRPKVPEIYLSGTFLLSSTSSQKHHLGP